MLTELVPWKLKWKQSPGSLRPLGSHLHQVVHAGSPAVKSGLQLLKVNQSEFPSPCGAGGQHSSSVILVTDGRLGVPPLASFPPRSKVFDNVKVFFFLSVYDIYTYY